MGTTRVLVTNEVLAQALFPGLDCRVEKVQNAYGAPDAFDVAVSGPEIPDAQWGTVTVETVRTDGVMVPRVVKVEAA